jgi:hypothetical protein
MRSGYVIGIGAGLASALLSYSATRGSPSPLLIVLLGLLTPLPSMLAGIGWGWLSALAAAATGSLATAVVAGPWAAVGYFLALGAPTALIAYLVYLSRPDPYGADAREWYPPGRLAAAMALLAGALPVVFLPLVGGSYETLRGPIASELQYASSRMPQLGMKQLTEQQVQGLTDLFITVVPAVLAGYWLIVFAVNAYLAGRIVRASGRLARDWPDLPAMAYPLGFPLLLVLAVAASYAPGAVGIAGTSFTGALLFAYFLAGLALVHFIARARAPWVVWLLYAALALFLPYAAIAVTLGGLLDPILKLKQRLGARRPSD